MGGEFISKIATRTNAKPRFRDPVCVHKVRVRHDAGKVWGTRLGAAVSKLVDSRFAISQVNGDSKVFVF